MNKKCKICNITHQKRGVCCSKKCSSTLRKQTCLIKYGVENPFQSEEIKDQIKQILIERYGVEYSSQSEEIKDQIKQTCLERYGVENPLQSEEVRDKVKQTCFEKFGVKYASQSKNFKEKVKQTCLEKYGGYTFQSDELKEKVKQTMFERYGTENAMQSEEVRNKSKQTCFEKYGVEHPLQSEDIKDKIKQTCLERYGVESFNQSHIPQEFLTQDWWNQRTGFLEAKELIGDSISESKIYLKAHQFRPDWPFKTISQPHQRVLNFLDDLEIKYEINDRKQIAPYELDVWIQSQRKAIEVNGLYWHSEEKGKGEEYHRMKTDLCREKEITLLHLSDFEIEKQWVSTQAKVVSFLSVSFP